MTSKTLWNMRPLRIDVENPAPGFRAGQLHFQDITNPNIKYQIDPAMGTFIGTVPNRINALLQNSSVQQAIVKGKSYLCVP